MSTTLQIVLTSGLTIFGIAVGSLLEKLFVTPISELRKCLGEIRFVVDYYANRIMDKEAKNQFREMACDLKEKQYVVSLLSLWAKLGIIPPIEQLNEISHSLIGMSNANKEEHAYDKKEKIIRILDVK